MNIIFDLDDTLICNTYNPRSSLETFTTTFGPKLSDSFILRPYTKKVLSDIKAAGAGVFLATYSMKGRALRTINMAGISWCFDQVFTRDNFDPCYGDEKTVRSFDAGDFILVDDKGLDDELTIKKLKFFGGDSAVHSDKLLIVPAFDGMDTDKVLLSVYQGIIQRIRSAAGAHETSP